MKRGGVCRPDACRDLCCFSLRKSLSHTSIIPPAPPPSSPGVQPNIVGQNRTIQDARLAIQWSQHSGHGGSLGPPSDASMRQLSVDIPFVITYIHLLIVILCCAVLRCAESKRSR